MKLSSPKATQRNDLTIYDRLECWWDPNDRSLAPLKRLVPARMRYLQRRAEWRRGGRVIDVGCGGGYMSEALCRAGSQVTGVDIAPGAISAASLRAREQRLDIEYRVADAQHLPFADNSFDSAVCTDVLVHVPDPQRVIRELARVVKPGGQIYYSAINRTLFASLVMVTLGEDLLGLVPRGTHDPTKFLKPKQLTSWFEDAGVRPRHSTGIGPVGWSSGLVFSDYPTKTVMYQGLAICGQSPAKALPH